MSQRKQGLHKAPTMGVASQAGWRVWVAPNLCIGNGMPTAPSRWAQWWQRVLLGWRWEYTEQ